jgi:Ca2+-binding EF-hand superfamily protein
VRLNLFELGTFFLCAGVNSALLASLCGCVVLQVLFVVDLDRNEDIASCFDRLDKDGNGVLSPEEVVSIIQDRMGFDEATARQLVDMFDQNKDGSLDKTEFMQLWTSMFGQ